MYFSTGQRVLGALFPTVQCVSLTRLCRRLPFLFFPFLLFSYSHFLKLLPSLLWSWVPFLFVFPRSTVACLISSLSTARHCLNPAVPTATHLSPPGTNEPNQPLPNPKPRNEHSSRYVAHLAHHVRTLPGLHRGLGAMPCRGHRPGLLPESRVGLLLHHHVWPVSHRLRCSRRQGPDVVVHGRHYVRSDIGNCRFVFDSYKDPSASLFSSCQNVNKRI